MRNEKICILVADDDKEIRDFLQMLLNGEGYETINAAEGGEALNSASADVDLYILDVNMPGVSGFMVASRIITDLLSNILNMDHDCTISYCISPNALVNIF